MGVHLCFMEGNSMPHGGYAPCLMPKTQPLCTGAESNLRDRVLGEVEKKSFIALPGKGGTAGLCPEKLFVPTQEDLVRSFIAMVQGWGCG